MRNPRQCALLVILALALAVSQVSSGNADEHRVVVGMATTSVNVTTWWHGENALDLTNRVGPTDTDVYHQSHFQSGNGGWLRAVARNYSISTTCHGRYVDLYDPGNNYLGTLNYVHVLSSLPENYTWIIPASGWDIVYLGTVIDPEPSDCAWHGAHLHQGGVGTNVQYGANLQSYVASQGQPDIISPTGDYTNRWIDKVTLIDSDGDGCTDSQEAAMGFNPHNYWDFYDVPTAAMPDPAPNGIKDRVVSVLDAMAVVRYSNLNSTTPPGGYPTGVCGDNPSFFGMDYDCDKNGDGRADGLDYDRYAGPLPNPPWDTGPPDGHINILDVWWVAKQMSLNLDCRH
jgi:hypothetical protein